MAIANSSKIAKDGRTMSPASLANLKPPYKKGENGHPQGGYALKNALKHILIKPYSEFTEADRMKMKVGDVLALSTVTGAILRESKSQDIVWERIDPIADKTPAGYQDNRQYNILVADEETKAELRMLMAGRSKVKQNDNSDT